MTMLTNYHYIVPLKSTEDTLKWQLLNCIFGSCDSAWQRPDYTGILWLEVERTRFLYRYLTDNP